MVKMPAVKKRAQIQILNVTRPNVVMQMVKTVKVTVVMRILRLTPRRTVKALIETKAEIKATRWDITGGSVGMAVEFLSPVRTGSPDVRNRSI